MIRKMIPLKGVIVLVLFVAVATGEGASVDAKKLSAREIHARVEEFLGKPRLAGVSYSDGVLLGTQALPSLEKTISQSEYERKHSRAVAALGIIRDVQALSSLEAYVDSTRGEVSLARFEALLVAQSAIGLLAAHDDNEDNAALTYLLKRSEVEFWDKQPWTFKEAGNERSIFMVRAVMNGLGLSGKEKARKRLEELARINDLTECAEDNHALNLRMRSTDALQELLSGGDIKISCSGGATSGLASSMNSACTTDPLVVQPITMSRHVKTIIDEAATKGSFVEASRLLQQKDFPDDVATNVELRLVDDRVTSFGALTSLDYVITCPSQLRRVLCQPGSRIKLVTSIVGFNLCETTGFVPLAGCAEEPGMNIIMGNPISGDVLAHEFGHNKGLHHRIDALRQAIMDPTAHSTNGVNNDECEAFRTP